MFEKLICQVAQALDERKIPYMLIGGQAVLLYGTPRLTRDIDITLGIDIDRMESMLSMCSALSLKTLTPDPVAFAQSTRVLPVEDSSTSIRVDFIFSYSPYEQEALKRAKAVMLGAQKVKFASPEDLVIHKLLAGRAVDLEDVKNILLKNRSGLAVEYIEKWLKEFGRIDEGKGLLQSFRNILKEVTD